MSVACHTLVTIRPELGFAVPPLLIVDGPAAGQKWLEQSGWHGKQGNRVVDGTFLLGMMGMAARTQALGVVLSLSCLVIGLIIAVMH